MLHRVFHQRFDGQRRNGEVFRLNVVDDAQIFAVAQLLQR